MEGDHLKTEPHQHPKILKKARYAEWERCNFPGTANGKVPPGLPWAGYGCCVQMTGNYVNGVEREASSSHSHMSLCTFRNSANSEHPPLVLLFTPESFQDCREEMLNNAPQVIPIVLTKTFFTPFLSKIKGNNSAMNVDDATPARVFDNSQDLLSLCTKTCLGHLKQ